MPAKCHARLDATVYDLEANLRLTRIGDDRGMPPAPQRNAAGLQQLPEAVPTKGGPFSRLE